MSFDIYECVCIFVSDHLKKKIFSNPTISTYHSHLKLFSIWMNKTFNLKDIRRIKKTHLHSYFTYLSEIRKQKKSSLEGAYTAFMRFFRSMKQRRIITKNHFKEFNITARRYQKNEKLLSPFEIMKLLRSVKEHYDFLEMENKLDCFSLFIHQRDICILTLFIACGLRRGEIQRIKTSEVDFDAQTILIQGKGNGKFTIKERKVFFSHPFLENIIEQYYKLRQELQGNNFFCNCYGDELHASSISTIFSRYCSFAFGKPKYNATITRKTFTSHLVRKKLNIEAIRNMLGHENCETTLRYYVHYSTSDLEKTWKETNPYAT